MPGHHHRPRWAVRAALVIALIAGVGVVAVPAAQATVRATAAVAPALDAPLHTTGADSTIYDAANQPVRLVGFNWSGTELGGRSDDQKIADVCGETWSTPADGLNGTSFQNMYQVIRDWGYNVIRLPVSWNDLEPVAPVWDAATGMYVHSWNYTYLADLESIVSNARAVGLSVILDMHQDYWSPALHNITNWNGTPGYCEGAGLPRWLYPSIDAKASTQQLVDFYDGMNWFYRDINDPQLTLTHATPWQFMYSAWDVLAYTFSSRSGFADYSAVIGADLLNEPYISYVGGDPPPGETVLQASGQRLNAFYSAIAPAVTNQAPNWLLFFEDSTGGYNTANPAARETPTMTGKPTVPGNWVYSMHDYNFSYETFSDGVPAHDDYGINLVTADLANATAWKVPLYIGEFTTFTSKTNPEQLTAADLTQTSMFVAWAQQHDVSWTFWAYDGGAAEAVINRTTNQAITTIQAALGSGLGGPPADQPPVASVAASCQTLTCTFDGSGSSDPDGTITQYTWDFGDGTTAAGATPPPHTYAAAGTYTVTLTVTDNGGLTDSSTQTVSPAGAAIAPFATDGFARSVPSGFGSADLGGTYATTGSASVAGGSGRLSAAKATTSTAYLPAIATTDADVRATLTTDEPPTTGAVYLAVLGRRIGPSTDYQGRVRLLTNGSVAISIVSEVSGAATTLAGELTLPGITYTPGMTFNVRLQVTGTGPTTLNLKVWPTTATEPATWQLSTTDSTPVLQTPGSVGLWTYLSGLATNSPVTMRVSNFVTTSP